MKIKLLTLLPSLLCLCTVSTLASAGIFNWENTADGDFNVGSNWVGGVAPLSFDDARFDLGASSPGYTVSFNTPTTTIANLKVLDDTLTLDLNGNTLTVSSDIDLSQGGMDNTMIDIEDGTVSGANLLTTNSAGLGAQSTLTLKDGGILNISNLAEIGKNGPGNVIVDGSGSQFNPTELTVGLNGMGDGLIEINKDATATVSNSSDAIVGGNTGSDGEIKVNSAGGGDALLDVMSNLVIGSQGNGKLSLMGSSADVSDANVLVGGDLTISANAGSTGLVELYDNATLSVSGDIDLGDGSGQGDGTLKIYGGGSGGLVVAGQDVNVGATGTSGPTTMNTVEIHYDGTLEGNNVTVGDNGIIELFTASGNQSTLLALSNVTNHGLIKGAGRILTDQETLYNYGTIAPDYLDPIDVENTLVFKSGSIMEAKFINDDFSQINIDGNLTFGVGEGDSAGDLILFFDENFLPTLNTPFNVLTWTGSRDGMFENIFADELGTLPSGLSFLYDYNDGGSGFLSITVVPEPSTWALMGLGCLFIFWRFRRRS